MATLTVRLIRSFEHRNIKLVVFRDIDLELTTKEFLDIVNREIQVRPGLPPPIRKYSYDTMKILHKAHGTKPNDLVINLEDDDKLILKDDLTLQDCGVAHETELSYFNLKDYEKYKADPSMTW